MYMDNFPVFQGDHVFDVVYGAGVVEKVIGSEKRFLVSFGNRTVAYRSDGTGIFTNRTLYWHNPVPGIPPKDAKAFDFYRELCVCLSKFCSDQRDLVNKLLEASNNGA